MTAIVTTTTTPTAMDRLSAQVLSHPLRQKTGGILPFKKYAAGLGVDLTNKAERKELMSIYNDMKVEFYRLNRKALGLAAADPTHNITKFRLHDHGGWDASGRMPTAASQKASKAKEIADRDAIIAKMQAELDALRKLVTPAA